MNALLQRCMWVAALCLGMVAPAWAHKASDAYLQVRDAVAVDGKNSPQLKLSIALRDLDLAIDSLDLDSNRELDWGEIKQRLPDIKNWIQAGFETQCNANSNPVDWVFEALEERSDGVYTRWAARSDCADAGFGLRYHLLKEEDATHRLLIGGSYAGQPVVAVVSPQGSGQWALSTVVAHSVQPVQRSGLAALMQFFPEGVHHIATGYDHLAFLLALLLPIALRRSANEALSHRRPGLGALLRTVTGFTLGHSVTLVLASLGWIGSPSWVEPAIAVTIGVSALLNLYPLRWVRGDVLALGFGLIHGLGFSNIMREAQVDSALLPWALAGFNLGVEAGQLVGVAVWCALYWSLSSWRHYDKVVVRGGSWALLAIAAYWALQRL
jgi:hypothetical protein